MLKSVNFGMSITTKNRFGAAFCVQLYNHFKRLTFKHNDMSRTKFIKSLDISYLFFKIVMQ